MSYGEGSIYRLQRCNFPLQIVLIFLFELIFIPSFSQITDYETQLYTVEDGLPHTIVRSIAQDRYGFIWVYTMHGVSRFDGSRFTSYYTALEELGNFRRDSRGDMWFVSFDGKLFSCN